MNIFSKSLKDFFTLRFLLLSTFPFLMSFLIFGAIFLYGGSQFIGFLNSGGGNLAEVNPAVHPIINYILTLALVKWVVVTFFYLFGTFFILLLSVIIAVIVIGFFTPYIVKTIQEEHYPKFIRSEIPFSKVLVMYLKTAGIFLFLILVCIPLLIIPGINLFIFNVPFYYLFHNILLTDVGSNIESYERFKLITKKEKKDFITVTLTCYILSLIPFLGLFLQVFFVIYLTHLFFEKSIQNSI